MIYIVDIDGTICQEVLGNDGKKDYEKAVPIYSRIDQINKLYDDGDTIIYWTARGASSGLNWRDFTKKQLREWKVKYSELWVGTKPHYDVWVDDKAKWIFDNDASVSK